MKKPRKVTMIAHRLGVAAFFLGLLASTAYSFDKVKTEESATRGDLAAQLELAQRYHGGEGINQSSPQVAFWLRKPPIKAVPKPCVIL